MLTDVKIRKLKTPAKNTKVYDERGLYLLLTPSGGKLWRWRYSISGKEKLLSIGSYADESLREAREERDRARRLVGHGIDPAAEKQKEKLSRTNAAAHTFESVAKEWLEAVKPKWAAVTYKDTVKRLEKYAYPN